METRFNLGDKARMRFNSDIPMGKVVTITGVKVEKTDITLNGVKLDVVETVTCDELAGVGFTEQRWYYESCFDGPLQVCGRCDNTPTDYKLIDGVRYCDGPTECYELQLRPASQ